MSVLPFCTLAGPTLYHTCHCPFRPLSCIKCHSLCERSRVTIWGFSSASMALHTHLLQPLPHCTVIIKQVLHPAISILLTAGELGTWRFRDSFIKSELHSFLNPQGLALLLSDTAYWLDDKGVHRALRERAEDKIPWFGKSLCTSVLSILVPLFALHFPAPPFKTEPHLTITHSFPSVFPQAVESNSYGVSFYEGLNRSFLFFFNFFSGVFISLSLSPRPGLEPVSPALAGRFSTTAPPGKPWTDRF